MAAEEEDAFTPKGGGMSHFQLPATAAELEKTASEELGSKASILGGSKTS